MNRLSRANFGRELIRARLYKQILTPEDNWNTYTVQPHKELDLYRISHNIYGTKDLYWVVAIVSGLTKPQDIVQAGTELTVPPIAWIQDKVIKSIKTVRQWTG